MKEIIITHMGSPQNEEEVKEFLFNIFNDRNLIHFPFQSFVARLISSMRKKESLYRYKKIGDNPCLRYTLELSEKLSAIFKKEGYIVKAKFTHLRPYIYEDFNKDSLIFPLYPQYSDSLLGIIKGKIVGARILKEWYYEEEFLSLMESKIKKSLEGTDPDKTALLFLAHGIPESFIINGDEYEKQIISTYESLKSRFPDYKSKLAYIGKVGPSKWLKPYADEIIDEFKKIENIVSIYLSFPIDNLEVLYDIDIEYKNKLIERGVKRFIRAELLNSKDDFSKALYKIIKRRL
jgi:ferrochelatase